MIKKEKPMMSVTAIIQGTQAQHWARGFSGMSGNNFLVLTLGDFMYEILYALYLV